MARKLRVPKVVDTFAVAFIAGGITWIALTSHYLRCPHTPALVISCVAGGIVLGTYVRRPVLRLGPVRISIGSARHGRSRKGARR
ncbi:hypothetical protein [Actinoallomurus sp. CA-150999]|uniref:hypothetical protein n=1 Tax=Actinoallomurus sp. CA-150999 TaxID=3239887 RepID=UPI003D94A87C